MDGGMAGFLSSVPCDLRSQSPEMEQSCCGSQFSILCAFKWICCFLLLNQLFECVCVRVCVVMGGVSVCDVL